MFRYIRLTGLLSLFAVISISAVQAQTRAFGVGIKALGNYYLTSDQSNPTGSSAASISGNYSAFVSDGAGNLVRLADGAGDVLTTASFGQLTSDINASVQQYILVNHDVSYVGVSGFGGGSFSEKASVVSNILPIGTKVNLRLQASISGNLYAPSDANYGGADVVGHLTITNSDGPSGIQFFERLHGGVLTSDLPSFIFPTRIGDTFTISGDSSFSADTRTQQKILQEASGLNIKVGFIAEALSPNVELIGSSGHNYTNLVVPEGISTSLLLGALVPCLGALAFRSKAQR